MQLRLKCPDCSAELLATKMLVSGTKLRCPGCEKVLTWKVKRKSSVIASIARESGDELHLPTFNLAGTGGMALEKSRRFNSADTPTPGSITFSDAADTQINSPTIDDILRYRSRIASLEKKLQRARKLTIRLRRERNSARDDFEQQLELQTQQKREAVDAATNKQLTQLDQLERQLADSQNRLIELRTDQQDAQHRFEELKKEKQKLETSLQEELDTVSAQLQAAISSQENSQQLQIQLDQTRVREEQLTNELQQARAHTEQIEVELRSVKDQLTTSNDRAETTKIELQELNSRNLRLEESYESRIAQLTEDLADTKRTAAQSEQELASLKTQLKSTADHVTDLERQIELEQEKSSDLEAKLTAATENVTSLQTQLLSAEDTAKGLNQKLKAIAGNLQLSNDQIALLDQQSFDANQLIHQLKSEKQDVFDSFKSQLAKAKDRLNDVTVRYARDIEDAKGESKELQTKLDTAITKAELLDEKSIRLEDENNAVRSETEASLSWITELEGKLQNTENEINQFTAELKQANSEREQLGKELATSQQQVVQLQQTLQNTQAELNDHLEEKAETQTLVATLTTEKEELTNQYQVEVESLTNQLGVAEETNVENNAQLASLRNELDLKKAQIVQLAEDLADSELRLSELEAEIHSQQQQTSDTVQKLAEANKRAEQIAATNLAAEQRLDKLAGEKRQLESTIADQQVSLESHAVEVGKLEGLQAEVAEVWSEFEVAVQNADNLRNELTTAKSDADGLQQQLMTSADCVNSLEAELTTANSRIQELDSELSGSLKVIERLTETRDESETLIFRLEREQENLARAHADEVSELNHRLNEATALSSEFGDLHQQLKIRQQNIDELQHQLSVAHEEVANFEKQVTAANAEVEKFQTGYEYANKQLVVAQQEQEAADQLLTELSEQKAAADQNYRVKIDELTLQLEAGTEASFELTNELEDERLRISLLEASLADANASLAAAESLFEEANLQTEGFHHSQDSTNSESGNRVAELTSELLDAKRNASSLETRLADADAMVESLRQQANEMREHYDSQVNSLQRTIDETKQSNDAEVNKLTQQIEQLQEKASQLEVDLTTSTQQTQDVEAKLTTARISFEGLEQLSKTLETQLASATQKQEESNSLTDSLRDEMASIEKQHELTVNEFTERFYSITGDQAELHIELSATRDLLRQAESELATALQNLQQLETELSDANSSFSSHESRLEESETKIQLLTQDLQNATQTIAKLKSEKAQQQSDKQATESRHRSDFDEQLAKSQQETERLTNELTKARQQHSEIEKQLTGARAQIEQLETELNNTQSQVETLAKESTDAQAAASAARTATEEQQKAHQAKIDELVDRIPDPVDEAYLESLQEKLGESRGHIQDLEGELQIAKHQTDSVRQELQDAQRSIRNLESLFEEDSVPDIELVCSDDDEDDSNVQTEDSVSLSSQLDQTDQTELQMATSSFTLEDTGDVTESLVITETSAKPTFRSSVLRSVMMSAAVFAVGCFTGHSLWTSTDETPKSTTSQTIAPFSSAPLVTDNAAKDDTAVDAEVIQPAENDAAISAQPTMSENATSDSVPFVSTAQTDAADLPTHNVDIDALYSQAISVFGKQDLPASESNPKTRKAQNVQDAEAWHSLGQHYRDLADAVQVPALVPGSTAFIAKRIHRVEERNELELKAIICLMQASRHSDPMSDQLKKPLAWYKDKRIDLYNDATQILSHPLNQHSK